MDNSNKNGNDNTNNLNIGEWDIDDENTKKENHENYESQYCTDKNNNETTLPSYDTNQLTDQIKLNTIHEKDVSYNLHEDNSQFNPQLDSEFNSKCDSHRDISLTENITIENSSLDNSTKDAASDTPNIELENSPTANPTQPLPPKNNPPNSFSTFFSSLRSTITTSRYTLPTLWIITFALSTLSLFTLPYRIMPITILISLSLILPKYRRFVLSAVIILFILSFYFLDLPFIVYFLSSSYHNPDKLISNIFVIDCVDKKVDDLFSKTIENLNVYFSVDLEKWSVVRNGEVYNNASKLDGFKGERYKSMFMKFGNGKKMRNVVYVVVGKDGDGLRCKEFLDGIIRNMVGGGGMYQFDNRKEKFVKI